MRDIKDIVGVFIVKKKKKILLTTELKFVLMNFRIELVHALGPLRGIHSGFHMGNANYNFEKKTNKLLLFLKKIFALLKILKNYELEI